MIEFLKALPALIRFLNAIQKANAARETETKLADDVKVIHDAFETKDASKLNDLFNSR